MAATISPEDLQTLHRNIDALAALDDSAVMAIDLLVHRVLEAAGAPYDEEARQARDAQWLAVQRPVAPPRRRRKKGGA